LHYQIGQKLSEFAPVEIVGYEVIEAGSPLPLGVGQFTIINKGVVNYALYIYR